MGASGVLCLAAVLTDDLDKPDNVVIQFFQLFSRNPPFCVVIATDPLGLIATHERTTNCKASDVPNAIIFDIPSARNLDCVLFIRDGVEGGLFRQSRWPRPMLRLGLLQCLDTVR